MIFVYIYIPQHCTCSQLPSNVSRTLVGNTLGNHSDVLGASQRCSNCISILDLTTGFTILDKDNWILCVLYQMFHVFCHVIITMIITSLSHCDKTFQLYQNIYRLSLCISATRHYMPNITMKPQRYHVTRMALFCLRHRPYNHDVIFCNQIAAVMIGIFFNTKNHISVSAYIIIFHMIPRHRNANCFRDSHVVTLACRNWDFGSWYFQMRNKYFC